MEDFAAFVAEKAPDLHWAVSGAVGAEDLYEGGFDGYRHGFGMTALRPRPLPDLMAEMKTALLRALAAKEGSVSPHIEGEVQHSARFESDTPPLILRPFCLLIRHKKWPPYRTAIFTNNL